MKISQKRFLVIDENMRLCLFLNPPKYESSNASKIRYCRHIHSQSPRLATARGSGIGPLIVGPFKVKAC